MRALKLALEQPVRGLGADNLARSGYFLQSNGNIAGVAHQRNHLILRVHDRGSGVQTNARRRL
jgi:hypothetical protein